MRKLKRPRMRLEKASLDRENEMEKTVNWFFVDGQMDSGTYRVCCGAWAVAYFESELDADNYVEAQNEIIKKRITNETSNTVSIA